MKTQYLAASVGAALVAVMMSASAAPMTTTFQAGGWSGQSSIWKENIPVGTGGYRVMTRFVTETFVVVHAFTLDKIWVAYNQGLATPNNTLRVLLWEVGPATNAEPATLPSTPSGVTDLFSQQQTYSPGGASINPVAGYVIFDVENVALSAGKRYAFALYYNHPNDNIFFWRDSNEDRTGSFYVLGGKGSPDKAYALQAVSGAHPARMATTFQATGWSGESYIQKYNALGGSGGDRSVVATRFNTETFVVNSAFTLDKVWVAYKSVGSGQTANLRVLVWEVGPATDAEPVAVPDTNPSLPSTASGVTDLFSEDQIYNMNGGSISPSASGYAVFDVENINLAAGKRYAFTLDYGGGTDIWVWPQANANDPTGSYYEAGVRNRFSSQDRPFAIQSAPPPPPPRGTVITLR